MSNPITFKIIYPSTQSAIQTQKNVTKFRALYFRG